MEDACTVFEGTLEELELLTEGGSPLTLAGFSLEHRESSVSEQAPTEAESSPGGENLPRYEFFFDQEEHFSWEEEFRGVDGLLDESPPQVIEEAPGIGGNSTTKGGGEM